MLVGGTTAAQLHLVLQCLTSCINLSRTKSQRMSQLLCSVDWQQASGNDGELLHSVI